MNINYQKITVFLFIMFGEKEKSYHVRQQIINDTSVTGPILADNID